MSRKVADDATPALPEPIAFLLLGIVLQDAYCESDEDGNRNGDQDPHGQRSPQFEASAQMKTAGL
jgi:hypothetical protein